MKFRTFLQAVNEPKAFSNHDNSQVLTQQGLALSPSQMYAKVMSGQLHSNMVEVRMKNDNGDLDYNPVDELELASVVEHIESQKSQLDESYTRLNTVIEKSDKDTDET